MGRRDDVLARLVEQKKKTLVLRFVGIAGSACVGLLAPGLAPGARLVVAGALALGYAFFAHPRVVARIDRARKDDEEARYPDPTARTTRAKDLVVTVDLDAPSLMGVPLDDSARALAPLGPVSDATDARLGALVWEDLGITARVDDDDRVLAFEIAARGDARVPFLSRGARCTLPSVDDAARDAALDALMGETGRDDTSRGVSERVYARGSACVSFFAHAGALVVSIHRADDGDASGIADAFGIA